MLGEITNPYSAIKDFVIQRSDGSPLYNLAVAVDDRDMGITHVVRGQDHVSNTPRQLMLVRALGAEPPVYAHIPLLHGPDGKKLSKRHGAASVQEVREQGYLPEAIRNYIALLGWGYDESTTFMTTDELVERFTLERVSKNPAVFDEQKLRWMNGRYMRELPVEDLHRRSRSSTAGRSRSRSSRSPGRRCRRWRVLAAGSLLEPPPTSGHSRARLWNGRATFREGLATVGEVTDWPVLVDVVRSVPEPFDAESVESVLRELVDEQGVKPKEVFQPLRVALTGTTVSPGIFESVAALGREETLARLEKPCRKPK